MAQKNKIKQKITGFLKGNRSVFLTFVIFILLADLFFIEGSSDIRIFSILAFSIFGILFYHISSRFVFGLCLLLLLILFLQFIFTGTSPMTEKTAVWFVLFFATGMIFQWKEISLIDGTVEKKNHLRSSLLVIASVFYRLLGPRLSFQIAMSPLGRGLFSFFVRSKKKEIMFQTKYHFFMQMSPYEYLMSGYFFLGETNPFETQVVRNNLSDGAVFVDVGAHIGWYTFVAASPVGSKGKVIAFEPNPSCITYFKKNLNLNSNFTNIILETFALSDTKGTAAFWVGDDMGGSFIKENTKRLTQKGNLKKIQVKTITLDEYLIKQNVKRLDLVKIDVEGAEMQVLKGAEKILKKYSPDLLIEIVNGTSHKNNFYKHDILSFLKKKGYYAYVPTASGLQLYKESIGEKAVNIYFSKHK